jgi:hypothetical protein
LGGSIGDTLLVVTEEEFEEIGLKRIEARRLGRLLEPFQTTSPAADAAPAPAPAPETPAAAAAEPQEALSPLGQFLAENGMGEYGSILAGQGAAEPADLDGMTPEDLVDCGIKLLHARKIIRLVGAL